MLLIHQPRGKLSWASSHCSWIECPRITLTVLLSSLQPPQLFPAVGPVCVALSVCLPVCIVLTNTCVQVPFLLKYPNASSCVSARCWVTPSSSEGLCPLLGLLLIFPWLLLHPCPNYPFLCRAQRYLVAAGSPG